MMREIVNHLWQSTVFAILAGLFTLAFRKNRAQVRYWLWFSASAKFLIPFALLLTVGGYLGRLPAAKSVPFPAMTHAVVEVAVPFPVTPLPTPSPRQNVDWIPGALVGVWVCGALGIALMRVRATLRIRAAVRDSRSLQIPFPVPVRTSSHPMEPGVVGIFRPVLLLPAGILEHLAPRQMELILAHELCHVRRRDNLTAAIHMLVEAVFWFHPLVWWISASLMEERERACDEGVLELGSEPRTYAESILKTCEFCVQSPLACVSGVTGADLKKRIARIMTQVGRTKLNFTRKLLLASFALAAILGPLVLGLRVAPQVWAQTGGGHRPAFEVASIKPDPGCQNKPRQPGPRTFTPSPDRMEMPCVSLKSLIQTAYGTFADGVSVNPQPLYMEGGPSWMQSEFYSVSAKAEVPPAHPQMMDGPMLQTLLEERFRLKLHREMREMPVYAMTLGKSGLKLQPLAQGACTPIDFVHPPEPPKPGESPNLCGVMAIHHTSNGKIQIDVSGSTMTQFAQRLSQLAARTVVDQTGIPGQFNFHLEYAPDPGTFGGNEASAGNRTNRVVPSPSAEAGPDLFVALQEQIGVNLSSEKGPVSVLLIDHAEKPTAN
jgi:bla regulator protein blaR1